MSCINVIVGYRTSQKAALDDLLQSCQATSTPRPCLEQWLTECPDLQAYAVQSDAWPVVAFEAVEQKCTVSFDPSQFPGAAVAAVVSEAFHSIALNEVTVRPSHDATALPRSPCSTDRFFIVSSLMYDLMTLWLDAKCPYLDLFCLTAQGVEVKFFLVKVPDAMASRCVAFARDLYCTRPNALRDRPSICISGDAKAVADALKPLLKSTLLFSISKTANPDKLNAKSVELATSSTCGFKTFLNPSQNWNGCIIFEAMAALNRGSTTMVSLSRTSFPRTSFVARRLSDIGFSRAWYFVRKDVLRFNCNAASDFDVIHIEDPSDVALVRFGSEAARACLLAESQSLFEKALHCNVPCALDHPRPFWVASTPACALAWQSPRPVIAIDARETLMKDDCFQVYYDAATELVKLTCYCATPVSESDARDGLTSKLWKTAFERVASVHNGNSKIDMIDNASHYSLSYVHAKRQPRRALAVTVYLDPKNAFDIVRREGPCAPTINDDEVIVDVELSNGVVAKWAEEAPVLNVADGTVDFSETLQQLFQAPRERELSGTLPRAVHESLLLLYLIDKAKVPKHEVTTIGRDQSSIPHVGSAWVKVDHDLYRLRQHPTHARGDGSGFKRVPNRIFCCEVRDFIHRRFGVALYETAPADLDDDVAKKFCEFIARTTDLPDLRNRLRELPHRFPTRAEAAALIQTLPGVCVGLSQALGALELGSGHNPSTYFFSNPIEAQPVPHRVIEWCDLHQLLAPEIPPGRRELDCVLSGTSALRRCEHLLAHFLVLGPEVHDSESLEEVLSRLADKLTTIAAEKRDFDLETTRAFLRDKNVPAKWRRLPTSGLWTETPGRIWVPTIAAMATVVETMSEGVQSPSPPPVLSSEPFLVYANDDETFSATQLPMEFGKNWLELMSDLPAATSTQRGPS